jgi:hypothetical protein
MKLKGNLALMGLALLLLISAGYFAFEKSAPLLESGQDGSYGGYIRKAYSKNGANFIDIDYIQTLTGRAAALRQLQDGTCMPEGDFTKEQVIKAVNELQGTEEEIATALYKVPGMGNCGPNGWWVDANDDPKILTIRVELQGPVLMTYDRGDRELGDFGPHNRIGSEDDLIGYEISWETLQNIIAGISYDLPFEIEIADDRVISIREIYRP